MGLLQQALRRSRLSTLVRYPLTPVAVIAVTYMVLVTIAYRLTENPGRPLFLIAPVEYFPLVMFVSLFIGALHIVGNGHSFVTKEGWRELATQMDAGFVYRSLVTGSLIWPFIDIYTFAKTRIPFIQDFRWDPLFARIEYEIHFGHWPWEWIVRALPTEQAVRHVHYTYNSIFWAVVFSTVLWNGLKPRATTRSLQLLLCYPLIWIILGNVLATVFSSAGPCFYGLLYDVDPFAPLMAELQSFERFGTVASQRSLWAGHIGEGIPGGISAMPSVHLALAAMIMFRAFAYSKWVGIAGALFFATMLVGSVRLGWHYAIDGYASLVLTWFLWVACGRFAKRWLDTTVVGAASSMDRERQAEAVRTFGKA